MPQPPDEAPDPARDRHRRVSEVFVAALELPPDERAAFVSSAFSGQPHLAEEVASLLAQEEGAENFLAGAAEWPRLDEVPVHAPPLPGERIGGFRLERVLGWGGMGVVYLAQQAQPRREVALKVLRPEAMTGRQRLRFEREAEVLGQLRHSAIAQVYEVGVERGPLGERPWFAMECVHGRPLNEYAAEEKLELRTRLELFVRICEGAHAAHEQGVVHRDLKPSNILVETDGRPRILDFGVAQTTGSDQAATLLTGTGQLLGTLAYMSPEQAVGDSRQVDRRADVYSLGVLLFELLTGELPHATRGLELHEAVRVISEVEAASLRTLRRELDLDLETIVGTALCRERERRYPSAEALAEDVRRWLRHEPIRARPPSLVYQFGKLARRNRALMGGALVILLALSAGLSVALFALERTREAEQRTAAERDAIRRLSDLRGLEDLRRRRDELWPATPSSVPVLASWLNEARNIASRLELHRGHLRVLRAGERREEPVGPPGAGPDDLAVTAALVAELETFLAPGQSLLDEIESRLRDALALEARTLSEPALAWREAVEAIADRARSPLYNGLCITPQLGLVPLGPDPRSGLWEFACYGSSGDVPLRDPQTRELVLDESSAIVLVLLPGGRFWMGGQSEDPAGPNWDPACQSPDGPGSAVNEGPPREVDLAPFFLGKFEISQGQYARVTGENPSYRGPGEVERGVTVSALHPVEFVSWHEAVAALLRVDLHLPTEAQWEYGLRAGSTSAWWLGDAVPLLAGRTNLADGSSLGAHYARGGAVDGTHTDGWMIHAPVGTFPPNAFGLHEMPGNVMEWCLDPYKVAYHHLPLRPGDGLVLASSPDRDRTVRGGCFSYGPHAARSSFRTDGLERWQSPAIGLRAARALRPGPRPR